MSGLPASDLRQQIPVFLYPRVSPLSILRIRPDILVSHPPEALKHAGDLIKL